MTPCPLDSLAFEYLLLPASLNTFVFIFVGLVPITHAKMMCAGCVRKAFCGVSPRRPGRTEGNVNCREVFQRNPKNPRILKTLVNADALPFFGDPSYDFLQVLVQQEYAGKKRKKKR